ncbi:UNVERIFIED_CONTAM: hypothetical protein K2H54_002638 [Gekko kuhli]
MARFSRLLEAEEAPEAAGPFAGPTLGPCLQRQGWGQEWPMELPTTATTAIPDPSPPPETTTHQGSIRGCYSSHSWEVLAAQQEQAVEAAEEGHAGHQQARQEARSILRHHAETRRREEGRGEEHTQRLLDRGMVKKQCALARLQFCAQAVLQSEEDALAPVPRFHF